MTEVRSSDKEITIAVIREELGTDGHLIENVASLIALNVASVRISLIDSQAPYAKLIDAFAGLQNEASQTSVSTIVVLQDVLGRELADIGTAAILAGVLTGEKEREELREASKRSIEDLRDSALRLKSRSADGKHTTLGDEIKKLTSKRH